MGTSKQGKTWGSKRGFQYLAGRCEHSECRTWCGFISRKDVLTCPVRGRSGYQMEGIKIYRRVS